MKLHKDSHVDHGLTTEQIAWLVQTFADRSAFFIETIELPEHLGTVPCGLHGPIMGDQPVPEDQTIQQIRGERKGPSRMCGRSRRRGQTVTVIAGPHEGEACILYTAYGGPLAPKEPWEVMGQAGEETSIKFWSEHALSL